MNHLKASLVTIGATSLFLGGMSAAVTLAWSGFVFGFMAGTVLTGTLIMAVKPWEPSPQGSTR